MIRCKAHARTTGERCKNPPVAGYQVCRMHGANRKNPGGAPAANRNARTHGAFETLSRSRLSEEDRETFDAVPAVADLTDELRVLRYMLLRLLGGVEQNIVAGFSVEQIKADEPTEISGIVHLAGEIRKVVKEMKEVGGPDPLTELVEAWKAGMNAESEGLAAQTVAAKLM
ncbi:MAG: hypothetical protein H0U02_10965 [Rubrobacter sp.]|nr:hypothetical protein [Rubrobacter sp.]MBA3789761.1 hypothetical protein [Rubrobacter sp.]